MTIWVDAQLSPRTAHWIAANFPVAAAPLRELYLRDADDEDIFAAARVADAIVLTKDSDFVRLLEQRGSAPKVLWLTCGSSSEEVLRDILSRHLSTTLVLLDSG